MVFRVHCILPPSRQDKQIGAFGSKLPRPAKVSLDNSDGTELHLVSITTDKVSHPLLWNPPSVIIHKGVPNLGYKVWKEREGTRLQSHSVTNAIGDRITPKPFWLTRKLRKQISQIRLAWGLISPNWWLVSHLDIGEGASHACELTDTRIKLMKTCGVVERPKQSALNW